MIVFENKASRREQCIAPPKNATLGGCQNNNIHIRIYVYAYVFTCMYIYM